MCKPDADVEIGADRSSLDSNGGPSLIYILEEDANRKEQLASFRDESPDARRKTVSHRQNEEQLLEEGKLARSEFSARIQRVTFGVFQGQPACLVLFLIDSCPRNRSWFRFRSADLEVGFQEEQPTIDTSVDNERGSLGLSFANSTLKSFMVMSEVSWKLTTSQSLLAFRPSALPASQQLGWRLHFDMRPNLGPAVRRSSGQKDLAAEDLEDLTRMEAILLGRHGPGAPAADNS